MKINLRQLLAEGKTDKVLAALLHTAILDGDDRDMALQLSARYAENERQQHAGTLAQEAYSLERNKINAAVLAVVRRLDDEERKTSESNLLTNQNKGSMEQKHSGSGDNVAGNKIGRQTNMGDKSTYIENQNPPLPQNTSSPIPQKVEDTPPPITPETPSGILGILLGWLPKNIRPFVAIGILSLVGYVGYHYFMPKPGQTATPPSVVVPTVEKVFVSGIVHINNGEPKPYEIKRMAFRDIDANPARIDAVGKFTFTDVKIPVNKRLLVDITFGDGKTVPTEELIVGEIDKETNTVRLPDFYITRPQPAKGGKPATSWKIQVNVNSGSGTQNATQN